MTAKRPKKPGPDPRLVAYHEAGHAAMALYLGVTLRSIRAQPGHDCSGEVDVVRTDDLGNGPWDITDGETRNQVERVILVGLAGQVAEWLAAGRHDELLSESHRWEGHLSHGDWEFVDCGGGFPMSGPEEAAYKRYLFHRAYRLLTLPLVWDGVARLAEALLERGELSGEEAARIWADRTRTKEAVRFATKARPRRLFLSPECRREFEAQ